MPRDGVPKYHVGYGKPPIETRYKPGTSGNPNGRPKGRGNLKHAAQGVFTSTVLVREGGKARRVTRLEALLLTTMERGLKGNDRAAQSAIKIALLLGLFNAEPGWDFSSNAGGRAGSVLCELPEIGVAFQGLAIPLMTRLRRLMPNVCRGGGGRSLSRAFA
jgi:Family of unknown function (DUF5681)